jgi:hypothetical protein
MTVGLLINVIVMITLIVGLTATFVELAGVSRNVGLFTRATLAPAARKATPSSTRSWWKHGRFNDSSLS